MGTTRGRDAAAIERGFRRWYARQHPEVAVDAIAIEPHLTGGRSNEIYFVTITSDAMDERLVVRLPPAGPTLFPSYELSVQADVHHAVHAAGIPAPAPCVVEDDDSWLGAPFLVMPRIDGRDAGDAPAFAPWITDADEEEQRALHVRFLDLLAAIHRVPCKGQTIAARLRGGDARDSAGALTAELDWWRDAVDWMFDGTPPAALVRIFDWCRDHQPAPPPATLLWGDVRLGNVLVDERMEPVAVLDWEMASIGPPEIDIAWYTALEAMTEHFVGARVPGFLTRDEVVEHLEGCLGRPLVDLEWFEVFAMARSAALNLRADRLRALERGRPARPAEDDAIIAYALEHIPDRAQ